MGSEHSASTQTTAAETRVPPLTSTSVSGALYTRHPDVEEEIERTLAGDQTQWQADELESETLVHLIRWLWKRGDRSAFAPLLKKLGRRLARVVRDHARGLKQHTADDMVDEISQDINVLIFAKAPNRRSDFLEVGFRQAVAQRTISYVKRLRGKSRPKEFEDVTEESDGKQYGGIGPIEAVAGKEPEPDEQVIAVEQSQRTPDWIRAGLAAIGDPRHREAVILHHLQGWPITNKDPNIPTLRTHFRVSARQITNWFATAFAQMRDAMGDVL